MSNAQDKLIVALDYDNFAQAKELIQILDNEVSIYKVGLELFLSTSGLIVDYLTIKNKKIFLDLKFHDIPNTASKACKVMSNKKIFMLNIHTSGGSKMISKCVEEVNAIDKDKLLIGVTMLTSLNDEDVKQLFHTELSASELAINLASIGKDNGLNGVVCSAQEAKAIKEKCGNQFVTVCPGIRPDWFEKNDQQRIVTPKQAMENGCDYIVVGRPITGNENPLEAVKKIKEEMQQGLNNAN